LLGASQSKKEFHHISPAWNVTLISGLSGLLPRQARGATDPTMKGFVVTIHENLPYARLFPS
jgi:hypothetical protein